MSDATYPENVQPIHFLRPILIGGAIAGAFDLTSAFLTFGWKVPLTVAAGLLGASAVSGGAFTWILGVLLHFTIAFGAATVYCLASRRLPFLASNWLVCGMFFGIAVHLVMNLVVLPLCAFHYMGPYEYRGLVQGLLVHMILIGLPISFSLHRFSRWS
ncbi:MAG TPA: hypothetical protein VK716_18120 [Terracidiphilus sp.]|jgi:hypothetical protein|nr:hypothetical protein [Terracidiphilus sp.]